MKAALASPPYSSRNIIASAQRSVNLYAEPNPQDSPFPFTYYQTPGLKLVGTAPAEGWRALYTSTTDQLFGVAGTKIYKISKEYAIVEIGQMSTSKGPVSMVDNGIDVVMVDGSTAGRKISLSGSVVSEINNVAFYGANRVDLVDGYLIFNRPSTNQWYISAFLDVAFDALDFAAKTGFSDKVVAVAAAKRQVFVFGTSTTEVWYNTGDADFTFGRMPGAFIQHGCISAASIIQTDGSLYWLSQSKEGECLVLRTEGYDRARISTFAIEKAMQSYETVSDAWAYVYQQEGHTFYVLNFPTADKTWVYDIASSMWHERMWMDPDGIEHRHRSSCYAFFNGKAVVGDWENGKLYEMSEAFHTDDGEEMRRIRAFPHMVDDGNRVKYSTFLADMEVGEGEGSSASPELRLRWSDSRGKAWGTSISKNLGAIGQFNRSCNFNRLGMARDRVFELSWSADCKTALNGAFVNAEPVAT